MEHGQKRKLVLTENGTVYKDKRSNLKNIVKTGQYMFRNRLFMQQIDVWRDVWRDNKL